MTATEFLHQINTAKKARKISDAAIARSIGVDRSYLAKVLKGQHAVSLDRLLQVCEVVGLKVRLEGFTD